MTYLLNLRGRVVSFGIWNMTSWVRSQIAAILVSCAWAMHISKHRTGLFTQWSWLSELSLWNNWNHVETPNKTKNTESLKSNTSPCHIQCLLPNSLSSSVLFFIFVHTVKSGIGTWASLSKSRLNRWSVILHLFYSGVSIYMFLHLDRYGYNLYNTCLQL